MASKSQGLAGFRVAIGWEHSKDEARTRTPGREGPGALVWGAVAEDVVDPPVPTQFRGPARPLRRRRDPAESAGGGSPCDDMGG